MPRFEPFAGIRYAPDRVVLDDVIAPPYDVISPEDQAGLESRSPYNSVRIELPRDDPPRDRYQVAGQLLRDWRSDGILVPDDRLGLYGYRMRFTDEAEQPRETVGVIGALKIEPPGQGILPHEQTMPKPKGDRLYLLRATHANLSPIWGLSLASGLAAMIPPPGDGAIRAVDTDGVTHELWPITDPGAAGAIADSVASAPVVIADGHHRFETALAYQEERRVATGRDGGYDFVMALIVELADEQLSVRAVHRLISRLPDDFDVAGALSGAFDLEPTDPADATIGARMQAAGALAVVTPAGAWLARPRPEQASASADQLDSSRLDQALASLPDHELTYQHGWDLATEAVTKGVAQAAVLLRPASVARIADTGRGGARMPPKTTFFWPKPRTGMVFRTVDD